MLLQHAWLAPLSKPDTITEADEEAEAEAEMAAARGEDVAEAQDVVGAKGGGNGNVGSAGRGDVVDAEVADWVVGAIETRRAGKMGKKAKPALHAAPLNAVQSPGQEPLVSEPLVSEPATNGEVAAL